MEGGQWRTKAGLALQERGCLRGRECRVDDASHPEGKHHSMAKGRVHGLELRARGVLALMGLGGG